MRISPNYTSSDWKSLAFESEMDWDKGAEIFFDRIDGRFLIPITKIEQYEYSGFAIMALDCLLIETLQQFREGKSKTPDKKGKNYFVAFLVNHFGEPFDEDMATKFYKQIRCGILHQAEVERDSLIRITSDLPIVKYTENHTGLIINRRKFHARLREVIQRYLEELRDKSNTDLRSNFRKKMDYIARENIVES